tara:strand:- start:1416 stop:1574 length:159 start_codon:yes stop_codon:yes gene_type:complete
MMSIIELIAEMAMYGLAWLIIGSGLTFIFAAAFFGYPEEISEEEYNDIINRE